MSTFSPASMDLLGNIFVANYYFTNNNSDVITTKFNPDGTFSWSKQFNSSGNENQDNPRKILTDFLGNVYVLGNASSNNYFDHKFFILKYNTNGVLVSSVEYKKPGNPITAVSDAMIDPNGNIFVCGKVDNYQTLDDSALVAKFDPSLNLLWAKTNKDSTTSNNFAQTLKIDPNGNIFVTEVSWTSLINSKYDQAGNVIWSRKIYVPLLFYSQHSSISFLDNNQNLYVSSNKNEVEGNDTSKTVLLKYDSSGILQWFTVYNISTYGTEIVRKLFSDNLNVYLDVSENDNISLAKIGQNGTLQWQKSMDHNVHYMNLDNSNRVITVGNKNTYNRTEMCMERFNSAGTREVSYLYTYNGTGIDQAVTFFNTNDSKLVLGGTHNSSVMLLKLAPSQQNSVTINRSVSKPILDLQSTFDTISFSTDLLPPDAYITDVNVTLDSILHPFVGDLEISLIHSQYKDTLVFRRGFNGDNFIGTVLDDTAASPICNSNAAPFTGYFKPCRPFSQFNSLLTEGPWILQIYDRKSSDTGELKAWTLTVTYNTLIGITQISSEIPSAFKLSQNYPNPFNPNTRIKFSVPKPSQIKLIVYNILGKEVSTLVNSSIKAGIYETDFNASNLSSGVYFYKLITENYTETKKNDLDQIIFMNKIILALILCNLLISITYSQVSTVWERRYNGTGADYDNASSIYVDNSGNVHVAGTSTGANSGLDYTVIKYNSAGSVLWTARYNGPGNGEDNAYLVKVDNNGNVYVAGSSTGIGTGLDYAVVKYNSAGVQQWIAIYNGPGNAVDEVYSLQVDNSGNVYVTGYSNGVTSMDDICTIKYNSSEAEQWVPIYNSPLERGVRRTGCVYRA